MLKPLILSALLVQTAWSQQGVSSGRPGAPQPPKWDLPDVQMPNSPNSPGNTILVDPIPGAALAKLSCKTIPGDKEWPADAVWTAEIPGVTKSRPQFKKITRPDWVLNAKGPDDVQAAVKFAAKHNVRVSIVNSGHDFVGRNDAPNGLWINVGNVRGVRVEGEYKATEKGTEGVKHDSGM
jgi:hypothetical protein